MKLIVLLIVSCLFTGMVSMQSAEYIINTKVYVTIADSDTDTVKYVREQVGYDAILGPYVRANCTGDESVWVAAYGADNYHFWYPFKNAIVNEVKNCAVGWYKDVELQPIHYVGRGKVGPGLGGSGRFLRIIGFESGWVGLGQDGALPAYQGAWVLDVSNGDMRFRYRDRGNVVRTCMLDWHAGDDFEAYFDYRGRSNTDLYIATKTWNGDGYTNVDSCFYGRINPRSVNHNPYFDIVMKGYGTYNSAFLFDSAYMRSYNNQISVDDQRCRRDSTDYPERIKPWQNLNWFNTRAALSAGSCNTPSYGWVGLTTGHVTGFVVREGGVFYSGDTLGGAGDSVAPLTVEDVKKFVDGELGLSDRRTWSGFLGFVFNLVNGDEINKYVPFWMFAIVIILPLFGFMLFLLLTITHSLTMTMLITTPFVFVITLGFPVHEAAAFMTATGWGALAILRMRL